MAAVMAKIRNIENCSPAHAFKATISKQQCGSEVQVAAVMAKIRNVVNTHIPISFVQCTCDMGRGGEFYCSMEVMIHATVYGALMFLCVQCLPLPLLQH